MIKPNKEWITDWKYGEDTKREKTIGNELLKIFTDFWEEGELENKSKSTQNRYGSALHALGGYLTEQGLFEDTELSPLELLLENISQDEGPLIHHDNEDWQNELDMVARKLYKYLKRSK